MNITDRPTLDTDEFIERGTHVQGLIEHARLLEQQRDVAVDALELAIQCSHHASACTVTQREKTGCVCGRTNAVNYAHATLAAIKESK